ncbi:MAG TPA: hypothetical protein VHE12_05690 [bacterium]|nr:hypothetical protein [bacterium]
MRTLKIALLAWLLSAALQAAQTEPKLNWAPALTGVSLLMGPIPLSSQDLPWGHALELEGWSYAATDIFQRFLPKGYGWLAYPIVLAVDAIYRAGELNQGHDDLALRKGLCDLGGIVAHAEVEIFQF